MVPVCIKILVISSFYTPFHILHNATMCLGLRKFAQDLYNVNKPRSRARMTHAVLNFKECLRLIMRNRVPNSEDVYEDGLVIAVRW